MKKLRGRHGARRRTAVAAGVYLIRGDAVRLHDRAAVRVSAVSADGSDRPAADFPTRTPALALTFVLVIGVVVRVRRRSSVGGGGSGDAIWPIRAVLESGLRQSRCRPWITSLNVPVRRGRSAALQRDCFDCAAYQPAGAFRFAQSDLPGDHSDPEFLHSERRAADSRQFPRDASIRDARAAEDTLLDTHTLLLQYMRALLFFVWPR